jgi:hypothetical protein
MRHEEKIQRSLGDDDRSLLNESFQPQCVRVKLRECVVLGDSRVGIVTCGFPQMSFKRLVEQTTNVEQMTNVE